MKKMKLRMVLMFAFVFMGISGLALEKQFVAAVYADCTNWMPEYNSDGSIKDYVRVCNDGGATYCEYCDGFDSNGKAINIRQGPCSQNTAPQSE